MDQRETGAGRGTVRGTVGPKELRRPGVTNSVQSLAEDTRNLTINDDEIKPQSSGFKGGGDAGTNSWAAYNADGLSSEKHVAGTLRLNPEAPEFIPRFLHSNEVVNGQNWSLSQLSDQSNGDASDSSRRDSELEHDDYVALSELKEFIDLITSEPAQYDSHVRYITDVLNHWIDKDEEILMMCIVNNIVDQAICEANFRYNGVRFCLHLSEHLKITTPQGSFKDILLQRCQREHLRRESLAVHTDGGVYLRGVTLFIGELCTRPFDENLITRLPDFITTLMEHPTTENLKCACQVLKLCGTVLEDKFRNTPTMERIMEGLQAFVDNSVSPSIKDLINNVIELRANNWKSIPRVSNIVNPYAAGDMASIDYGNYGMFDNSYNPSYDFGPCGDEQDTDVCEAFDEFLRASGQMP